MPRRDRALDTTLDEWSRVIAANLTGIAPPVSGGFMSSGVIKQDQASGPVV